MFYSDVILSKKGKLSRVWLAAHAERRMTKAMILETNIVKSVSSIINKREEQDAIPMALRLSGQLLFGVVRIYSRQAKYLLDDCNEALLKLKTAFRAGAVDMTMPTSRNAITLPNRPTVLDLALPDPTFEGWDVDSVAGSSAAQPTPRSIRSQSYTARLEDISIQRYPGQEDVEESRFSALGPAGFFDPDAGQELELDQSVMTVPRRDSQGREVDANGDLIEDDGSSIGVARDAPSQAGRHSINLGDLTGFDDFGGGDDFPIMAEGAGELDLGLEEFEAQRQRSSTPIGTQSLMQDLTPRTAMKVQQAAEKREAMTTMERKRKQVVDSRIELQDAATQANRANLAALLAKEQYLPRSRAYMQLLDFHANPGRHVLSPFTGSRGLLDPRLSELFTFDASVLRRQRSPSIESQREGPSEKRLRMESGHGGHEGEEADDLSIGVARRAERASLTGGDDLALLPDISFEGFGDGDDDDDMPMDMPPMAMETSATADVGPRRSSRKRNTDQREQQQDRERNAYDERGELPRLATPSVIAGSTAGDERITPDSPSSSHLLRAFDSHVPADATNLAAETQASTHLGLSKNTVRAIKVLRKQLQPVDDQEEDRQLSFQAVTTNTTRRAAAGFFFELLVLGTKDCVKVEQKDSFGDIVIQARPSLWTDEGQVSAA